MKAHCYFLTAAMAILGWWLPSSWHQAPPAAAAAPAQDGESTSNLPSGGTSGPASALERCHRILKGSDARVSGFDPLQGGVPLMDSAEEESLAVLIAGESIAGYLPKGPERLRALEAMSWEVREAALTALSLREPEETLRFLLSPEGLRLTTNSGLLERLAARDPAAALALLRGSPNGVKFSRTAWPQVLAACAKSEPGLALQALREAPHAFRENGMAEILKHRASSDPAGTLEWIRQLPPELRTYARPDTVIETWAESDPAAAFAAWQSLPAGSAVPAMEAAVARWAEKDPESLLKRASDLPPDSPEALESLTEAITAIGIRDPERALALAGKAPGSILPEIRRRIVSSWAATDPAAAASYAAAFRDPEIRAGLFSGLAAIAGQLPPEQRRTMAMQAGPDTAAGFQILYGIDRQEALTHFAAMAPEVRRDAFTGTGFSLLETSPSAAAELVMMLDFSGADERSAGHTRNAASHVTAGWVQSDPAAAARWVNTLPPGEAQEWAAANLVLNWSRHDPAAAQSWAESCPPGPLRTRAIASLTGQVP